MRTTVVLDADTEAELRRVMVARGISFTQALNDAIRAGIVRSEGVRSFTRPRDLGVPKMDLDQAGQLATALEDEEVVRRMQLDHQYRTEASPAAADSN